MKTLAQIFITLLIAVPAISIANLSSGQCLNLKGIQGQAVIDYKAGEKDVALESMFQAAIKIESDSSTCNYNQNKMQWFLSDLSLYAEKTHSPEVCAYLVKQSLNYFPSKYHEPQNPARNAFLYNFSKCLQHESTKEVTVQAIDQNKTWKPIYKDLMKIKIEYVDMVNWPNSILDLAIDSKEKNICKLVEKSMQRHFAFGEYEPILSELKKKKIIENVKFLNMSEQEYFSNKIYFSNTDDLSATFLFDPFISKGFRFENVYIFDQPNLGEEQLNNWNNESKGGRTYISDGAVFFKFNSEYYALNYQWKTKTHSIIMIPIQNINSDQKIENKELCNFSKNQILDQDTPNFIDPLIQVSRKIMGNDGPYMCYGQIGSSLQRRRNELISVKSEVFNMPWLIDQRIDPNSIDQSLNFMQDWGSRGVWSYAVYQELLNNIDQFRLDMHDYLITQHDFDSEKANVYVDSVLSKILGIYTQAQPKGSEDQLSLEILKGGSLDKIQHLYITQKRKASGLLNLSVLNPEILKKLIELGENVESVNGFGKTTLMHAVQYNQLESVRILLENGANPNKVTLSEHDLKWECDVNLSANNVSVLDYAARYANIEIIELLIKNGADVNLKNSAGIGFKDWLLKTLKQSEKKDKIFTPDFEVNEYLSIEQIEGLLTKYFD